MSDLSPEVAEMLKERILLKRNIVGNCWIYTGTTDAYGYGVIGHLSCMGGRATKVHRISFAIFKNNNNFAPQVNHTRDCKSKACFNPDHLYPGTQKENINDIYPNARRLR